jgi:hypothetical protein
VPTGPPGAAPGFDAFRPGVDIVVAPLSPLLLLRGEGTIDRTRGDARWNASARA